MTMRHDAAGGIPAMDLVAATFAASLAVALGAGGFSLLSERRPGLLIALDPGAAIAAEDTLTFASDCSGLAYDAPSGAFWS